MTSLESATHRDEIQGQIDDRPERRPLKTMHQVTLTHHDGYAELSITSDHMRDIVRIYIREHTATVVKERDNDVLRGKTFSEGLGQYVLECLVREEPPTEEEVHRRLYGGI